MTAVLALDPGTATGWALRTVDWHTVCGTQNFKPGRFKGGGMRNPRFRGWLAEVLAAIVVSAQDWSKSQTVGGNQHMAKVAEGPATLSDNLATVTQRAPKSGASERTQKMASHRAAQSGSSAVTAEGTCTTKHGTTATMNVAGQQKTGKDRSKAASAVTQVESESTLGAGVLAAEVDSGSTPMAADCAAGPANDSEAGAPALRPGPTLLATSSGNSATNCPQLHACITTVRAYDLADATNPRQPHISGAEAAAGVVDATVGNGSDDRPPDEAAPTPWRLIVLTLTSGLMSAEPALAGPSRVRLARKACAA